NLLQTIPKADHNQLEQIDYVQQSSHILEGFPCYDFDKTLYQEKRFQLIESIDNFHETTNKINLVAVFKILSNFPFCMINEIDKLQSLLTNKLQLDIIHDFLQVFLHNLIVINSKEDYFKIELRAFRSSQPIQTKTLRFTVEQQIDAFNTLYNSTLVAEILKNMFDAINNLITDDKILEFITWIAINLDCFHYTIIENIFHWIEKILAKKQDADLINSLQFLRVVSDYEITKIKIKNREETIQSNLAKRENLFEATIKNLNEINKLYDGSLIDNVEIISDLYKSLSSFIRLETLEDFRGISEFELTQLTASNLKALENLSNKNTVDRMIKTLNKQSKVKVEWEIRAKINIYLTENGNNNQLRGKRLDNRVNQSIESIFSDLTLTVIDI
ncbi:unnamed protein product, partial [Rotaria magnacalcarata]